MGLSQMKEELHQQLWKAQQRWFALRDQGETKHSLKMRGLHEHGNPNYATRGLIFTGNTRLSYEHVLRGFVEYAHEHGRQQNSEIDKRDMRDYLVHLIDRRLSASYLDKVRSACVKFGALYGKYESFHAMSMKMGAKIREFQKQGLLASAAHPRITAEVADRAIDRLRELDAQCPARAYHIAAELQRHCGLRAEEATARMKAERLGDQTVVVLGKGGKERALPVPAHLHGQLRAFFERTGASRLAPLAAYRAAFRRAVFQVGGMTTGTHALRRLWATEYKNAQYRQYRREGRTAKKAYEAAVADTLEALGHGRDRTELQAAYLSAA